MQVDSHIHTLRPSWAEISSGALRHNLAQVRAQVGARAGILAMIKADAYGHGAVRVAKALSGEKLAGFGVATLEEALELRAAGIEQTILVMGGLMGIGRRAARCAIEHRITCVIHSSDALKVLDEEASALGRVAEVHLKIDTGMGRMGVQSHALAALLDTLASCQHVKLCGVMSHLASADDAEYSAEQLRQFLSMQELIRARHAAPLIWHLGLSAAIINAEAQPEFCFPGSLHDGDQYWVRPGIMLYGIAPFEQDRGKCELQPAMTLKSRIILMRTLPAGAKVSYGGIWQAERESCIGTVPIGYADGYPWRAQTNNHCVIRGQAVPIVGRITMDLLLCDLSDIPEAAIGDEVSLFGNVPGALQAEDLAASVGTSPYEVVCRISKRVPRVGVK